MINVKDFISIIFYLALIVLIVVLIVLVIRAINTLGKVDRALDDINYKSSKLDGLFNAIDGVTDALVTVSDSFVSTIAMGIENLFKRKKGKNE